MLGLLRRLEPPERQQELGQRELLLARQSGLALRKPERLVLGEPQPEPVPHKQVRREPLLGLRE